MANDFTIILGRLTPPTNPEQNHGTAFFVGPCSSGAYDTIITIRSQADLALLGYGPLVHAVAFALGRAGGPILAMRSRSTVLGALWGPGLVKEPSGRATLYVYGRIKLSGADANGDLTFQAKTLGVTLQVQVGGALAASVSNKAILLTVPAATPASDVVTFWNGADPGAVAAKALAAIKAEGTGASNAGTTMAITAFDLGTLAYVGIDAGYSVRQKENGNNTALGSSYAGSVLTVDLATDADGTATSTANGVVAQIAAGAVGKFTVTPISAGTGLAGVQAAAENIPFGSSGAVSLSGTPLDRANLVVEVTRAGTVGGSTQPVIRWSIDFPRKEDSVKLGRGNGSLAILARRGGLKVLVTQQSGTSKSVTHAFDGVTLELQLGTSGAGVPNTTASAAATYLRSVARLRAAFLIYLPTGDGSEVMEVAPLTNCTAPSITQSGDVLVSSSAVPIRNGVVDTGVSLTFTGVWDLGDKVAAQLSGPASSVDDMGSAADVALADQVNRQAGIVFISSVSRTQGATLGAKVRAVLSTRQMWALVQSVEWDPESQTEAAWRDGIVSDWLGYNEALLFRADSSNATISAHTGRVITLPTITLAAGSILLAPYHQDIGQVLEGPTSGAVPNLRGIWHDEASDTTLTDQRGINLRTDEDAPGSFYFVKSPNMEDSSFAARNRIEFIRTDLVLAREAKLALRQFRNYVLEYQTAAGDDGSVAGALTLASTSRVEAALSANIERELKRVKKDGRNSVSPLGPGQKYARVLRTNDFSYDKTINAEVGANKLVPAERGTITVFEQALAA